MVRVWGRTILQKQDADVPKEVDQAFSTKPCFGGIVQPNLEAAKVQSHTTFLDSPVKRIISEKCLVWSEEEYLTSDSMMPAICQACKNDLTVIKNEEISDSSFEISKSDEKTDVISETDADFNAENEETKSVLDDLIKSDTSQDIGEGMVTRFSCKTCDKTFCNKRTWKQHAMSRHKKRSCSECGDTFAGEKLLRAHCVSLKHVMKYECFFCDEVFLNQRKRNSHSDTDHVLQVDAMTCDFCDKVFPDNETKTNHMRTEHSKQYAGQKPAIARNRQHGYEYTCPLCNEYDAKERKMYWSHLRAVHREDSIDCNTYKCHYTCVGSQLMVVHKLDKHTIDRNDSKNYINGGQVEQCRCDMCGQELTWSQLLPHYKDNHDAIMDVRRFLCLTCGIDFNSHYLRQRHRKVVHIRKDTYSCDKCGKQLHGKGTLEKHMKKVHMKDSLKKQCQFCKSWFQGAENLGNHVRRAHTGETPFKCAYCEESFFSSTNLYEHKTHVHPCSWNADKKRKAWLRENPDKDPSEYKMDCHLCGTLWTTLNELRQHWHEVHPNQIDIHVREKSKSKPFTCELCGAGFSRATYLQIHTFKKHDIDRTRCPICSEEFPDREGVVEHLTEEHKTKTRQINVMCQHCGHECFESNLKEHMKMHDASFNRPTRCTYCQKEFPKYVNMARHRKIAHREEYNSDRERLMVEEGSLNRDMKKYNQKATCAICGTTLCSRGQLHLHMKARHGTGLPGYGKRGHGRAQQNFAERAVSPPPT